MEEQKAGSSALRGSGGYVDHVIHLTEARFLQLPEGSLPPMSGVPNYPEDVLEKEGEGK